MIRRFSFFVLLFALVAVSSPSTAAACTIDSECNYPQEHCQMGAFDEGVCQPGPGPGTPEPAATCGGDTCVGGQICCVATNFSVTPFCSPQATCQALQIAADNPNTDTTGSPSGGAAHENADPAGGSTVALINPLKVDTVPEFLALILKAVVNLGSIILVLMLVYVGFLFVVAQGNEEKLKNAKSALLWTVVGGLVLLGAQAISLVIQATVGGLQ